MFTHGLFSLPRHRGETQELADIRDTAASTHGVHAPVEVERSEVLRTEHDIEDDEGQESEQEHNEQIAQCVAMRDSGRRGPVDVSPPPLCGEASDELAVPACSLGKLELVDTAGRVFDRDRRHPGIVCTGFHKPNVPHRKSRKQRERPGRGTIHRDNTSFFAPAVTSKNRRPRIKLSSRSKRCRLNAAATGGQRHKPRHLSRDIGIVSAPRRFAVRERSPAGLCSFLPGTYLGDATSDAIGSITLLGVLRKLQQELTT